MKRIGLIFLCLNVLAFCVNAQNTDAIDSLESAIKQCTKPKAKIKTQLRLVNELNYQTIYSVSLCRKALITANASNFFKLGLQARFALAQSYSKNLMYDSMHFQLSELRQIALEQEEPKYAIKALNYHGNFLVEQGELHDAILYYKKARETADSVSLIDSFWWIHNNIGVCFNDLGSQREAIGHFKIYEQNLASTQLEYRARFHYNMAQSFIGLNKLDSAKWHSKKSLNFRQKINRPTQVAESQLQILNLVHGQYKGNPAYYSDLRNAIGYASLSADKCPSIDMKEQVYASIYPIYQSLGEHEKALQYLEKLYELKIANNSDLKAQQVITELKLEMVKQQQQNHIAQLEKANKITQLESEKANHLTTIFILIGVVLLVLLVAMWFLNRQRIQAKSLQVERQQQQIADLQQKQELNTLNGMLEGEEKERRRIAQELHDGIGNALSSIQIQLNTIEAKLPEINDNSQYQKASKLIDDTCVEVRNLSHNMMPASLTKLGWQKAIEELIDRLQDNDKLQFHLEDLIGRNIRLNEKIEITIYRIVQELLQNILKHANATEVIVQISKPETEIQLLVEDDGSGFNKYSAQKGLGLTGIETRLKSIDGSMNIDSSPNNGTSIEISIPK